MYDENLIQFQSNDDQNLEISFIWDLERNRLVDTIQDAKDFNWQENFIQTGFNLYLSDEKHTYYKNTNNQSQSIFCRGRDHNAKMSWCLKLYSSAQILLIKEMLKRWDAYKQLKTTETFENFKFLIDQNEFDDTVFASI